MKEVDPFLAYKVGLKDGLQMALDICKLASENDIEYLISKQLEKIDDRAEKP